MDRVADFFSQRTPRRVVALAVFFAVLFLFRHLAILLVFFVAFERSLAASSAFLARHLKASRKKCVFLVLGAVGVLDVAVGWFGVGKTVRTFTALQENYPEHLSALREHPLVVRFQEQFGGMDAVIESAKHYSGSALTAASAVGHFVLHIIMGFVLAVVYTLEREEIETFWTGVDRRSIIGTLARWFGHVSDATIVTVQLQLIVAACNAVLTLPVLILIGVPNIGALMLLIFVSALVPVIGNVVSGVTLSLLAYQQKGWLGVGIFIGLTFLLNKIESYSLSPRLTARHVKIPGFLLIVSLIACEHLFGFKGLFLSFPILFVAGRIRTDFAEEDTGSPSPIDLSDSPCQLPDGAQMRASALRSGVELETSRSALGTVRPSGPTPDEGAAKPTSETPIA